MSRLDSTPSATPTDSQVQYDTLSHDDEQQAHEVAPLAAAVPLSQVQQTSDELTACGAVKEIAEFWPFLLRFGISAVEVAVLSWVIADKELDLVGAYAAYQSAIYLAIGLLYASIFPVNILISEAKEKEDEALEEGDHAKVEMARKEVQTVWRQGILFATILSVPAVVFGFTASPLFKLMNQPDKVQAHSKNYLMYSAPGFVADIFYRLTARATTGLGVRKSILVADVIDNIAEVTLAYILLNGKLGLPEMGMGGVGLAYTISKTMTFLGHLAYMYFSPARFKFDYSLYNLFDFSGPFFHWELFKKLISAGIPDGLSSVLSGVAGMLVVMFCGHSGTPALVGVQAASVFAGFANFHMSTIFNVATNRIGRYNHIVRDEKNEYSLEKKQVAANNIILYTKLMSGACILISLLACGLTFLIPRQLSTLLVDDNNVTQQAHLNSAMSFLKVQGVLEVIGGAAATPYCVLAGMLDNAFLAKLAFLCEVLINIGSAATTRYALDKDASWVFASTGPGFTVMTIALLLRCYQKLKNFSGGLEVETADNRETTLVVNDDQPPASNRRARSSLLSEDWDSKTNSQRAFHMMRDLFVSSGDLEHEGESAQAAPSAEASVP